MTVYWRPAARTDVARIVAHISEENPVAATSLAVFPRRGRRGLIRGTRELVAIRPYVLVDDIDRAGDVTILRVWHSAQDRS